MHRSHGTRSGRRARSSALALGAALLVALAPRAEADDGTTSAPVATLCGEAQQTVFSCETTNGKVLSICTEGEVHRDTGRVQYRFGKVGAVELTHPDPLPPAAHGHPFAMYTYLAEEARQAGLSYYLGFRRQDVAYEVYEGHPTGLPPDAFSAETRQRAGVRVGTYPGPGTARGTLLADIPRSARVRGTLAGFGIDWAVTDRWMHRKSPTPE